MFFGVPIYSRHSYSSRWNFDHHQSVDRLGIGFQLADKNNKQHILFISYSQLVRLLTEIICSDLPCPLGAVDDLNGDPLDQLYIIEYTRATKQLTIHSGDRNAPIIDLSDQLDFFLSEFVFYNKYFADLIQDGFQLPN